jgi:type I restriction-modification system DNA methylase subunit
MRVNCVLTFCLALCRQLLAWFTEVIEPYHGRVFAPACGSGGMFVHSARFVAEHKKNPAAELSIQGVEKTDETGRLYPMNLAEGNDKRN